MAFNYSPKIVRDSSLVLCLDAANPNSFVSGSAVWRDISKGGNNGTLTNEPTYNSANGGSIVFDGVDDYVSITNSSTNLSYGNSDFSVFCWVYVSSFNQYSAIVGKCDSTATRTEWSLQISRQATFRPAFIATDNISTWAVELNSPNTLNFNQWYNIGVSRIGSTFTLYVNGSSVISTNNNITISSNNLNVEIGRLVGDSTYDFTGRVSNTLIYKNKGLSASEILQNYNALKGRYGLR